MSTNLRKLSQMLEGSMKPYYLWKRKYKYNTDYNNAYEVLWDVPRKVELVLQSLNSFPKEDTEAGIRKREYVANSVISLSKTLRQVSKELSEIGNSMLTNASSSQYNPEELERFEF